MNVVSILPIFFLYLLQPNAIEAHVSYAEYPDAAYNLSVLETSIFVVVQNISTHFTCSEAVKTYIAKYEITHILIKNLSAEDKAARVVGNGLLWYKMLNRLVHLLKNVKTYSECHSTVREALNTLFAKASLRVPTKDDLREAILGILKIHQVYGYNATTQLRLGIFGDIHTGVTLTYDECMEIAHRAIFIGLHILAYQWLDAAQKTAEDYDQITMLEKSWNTLAYQVGLNCSDFLHPIAIGRHQLRFPRLWKYPMYATCRGESGPEFVKHFRPLDHQLICYYKRTGNWYLALNPAKVEVLSKDPPILMFHQFIGNESLEYVERNSFVIQEEVVNSRSIPLTSEQEEVVAEFGKFVTNAHLTLDPQVLIEQKHPFIRRLSLKMDMVTGITVDAGDTTICYYGSLGSQIDIHHDSYQYSSISIPEIGERLGTFLMFLQEPELGGNLGFPMIDVHVKPQKGNAVIWLNNLDDGSIDLRTFHVGCPVILGKKKIMRFIPFDIDNLHEFPCSLEKRNVEYPMEMLLSIPKAAGSQ